MGLSLVPGLKDLWGNFHTFAQVSKISGGTNTSNTGPVAAVKHWLNHRMYAEPRPLQVATNVAGELVHMELDNLNTCSAPTPVIQMMAATVG